MLVAARRSADLALVGSSSLDQRKVNGYAVLLELNGRLDLQE